MTLINRFEQFHRKARHNRWIAWFAIFCRIALAFGFIFPGFVKIFGERFTALSDIHPMGSYLTALFHTGYYYTTIGVFQVLAGFLLLIPRTATLGAIIYFPIILNITILSFAVRFDGSLLSSPLMCLANIFLLCWDYHKLKFIFPWNHKIANSSLLTSEEKTTHFPWKFVLGSFVAFITVVGSVLTMNAIMIMPKNSLSACRQECKDAENKVDCYNFCECVHKDGTPLDQCLACYSISEN